MSDIDRIMSNARVRLPGALDDAMKAELFVVLGEFFNGANCWQEEIPFRTKPGQQTYDIAPGGIGQIERLLYVENPDRIKLHAVLDEPGVLYLRYAPSMVQTCIATVVLNVSDPLDREDFPECPGWVLAKYHGWITDGLIGRMMAQMAKPYSNERLSIYHLRRFRNGVIEAKIEAKTGHVYGAQSWRFPQAMTRHR